MKISLFVVLAVFLVAGALISAGCTSPTQAEISTIDTTATATTAPVTTVETTAVAVTTTYEAVTPLPSAQYIDLQISKDRTNGKITLLYNGGPGQQITQSVRMKVTREDGTVSDQLMNGGGTPNVGSTIVVPSSRTGTDHCEVWVTSAGKVYKVMDEEVSSPNPYATTSS
ncbi:MAG: hypothetical protein WC342_01820 [Methanoregula sp.]|jgi:hypothetical protein